MPGKSKKKLLNGLEREAFIKDRQLMKKYGSKHRVFSKPDVFLAVLIANLPNIRVLELHFERCDEPCKTRTNWQRSRVDFPIWTWEIVDFNAGNGRRQCLQKLEAVTIAHIGGLFYCSRGLPWLRLPSINNLRLSGVNLPCKVDLCKRSSTLKNLSLTQVSISLHDLDSLLETPKSLVSPGFDCCIFLIFPPAHLLVHRHLQTSSNQLVSTTVQHSAREVSLFPATPWVDYIRWDDSYDHVAILPPTMFKGFEKLEDLEVGPWQLLTNLDISDIRGLPMSHQHESMVSLVEILPPTLKSIRITGRGDGHLMSPLKALARARKDLLTYAFSKLNYVAVETSINKWWIERTFITLLTTADSILFSIPELRVTMKRLVILNGDALAYKKCSKRMVMLPS